jgi:hypothetical protein
MRTADAAFTGIRFRLSCTVRVRSPDLWITLTQYHRVHTRRR